MCWFIESRENSPFKFFKNSHDWNFYVPQDCGNQYEFKNDVKTAGRDCGLFVCMWAFTICSGAIISFDQSCL